MAQKILGLDLGTNSIGISLRDPDKGKELKDQIEYFSSEIFHSGVGTNKNGEYSYAAERTKYRQGRRLYETRRRRSWATLQLLIDEGCCPMKQKSLDHWSTYDKSRGLKREFPIEDKLFESWIKLDFNGDGKPDYTSPYQLRRDLATEQMDFTLPQNRYKLGRAMYHISQRRGFKSSKGETIKSQTEEESESSEAEEDIAQEMKLSEMKRSQQMTKLMDENQLHTVGEAFALIESRGLRVRASEYQAVRSQYEDEIRYIFNFQDGLSIDSTLFKRLISKRKGEGTIFYRKPLRSQKRLVGKCTLEPDKRRCQQSHPEYEKFRAWSFINNIRYKTEGDNGWQELPLSLRERIYADKFIGRVKANFRFGEISKMITSELGSVELNFADDQNVAGCPVTARLRKLLGDDWESWTQTGVHRHRTGNGSNSTKPDHQVCYDALDLWHVCVTMDDPDDVLDFAKGQLGWDDKQAKGLRRLWSDIDEGYGMLSLKAIRNINRMLVRGLKYSDAVILAKAPEILEQTDNDIDTLIDKYKRCVKSTVLQTKDVYKIANNLIAEYKSLAVEDRFAEHDNSYTLTSEDKADVCSHASSYFGEKSWNSFAPSKREFIQKEVEELYQQFFSSIERKFYSVPREDVALRSFLSEQYPSIDNKQWEKLYHPSQIESEKPTNFKSDRDKWRLNKPVMGNMRNPVAMRTLKILRKKINELLDDGKISYDNTRVVIETTRSLQDANRRWAINDFQNKREEENRQIKGILKELFPDRDITASDVDQGRYTIEQLSTEPLNLDSKAKEPRFSQTDIKKLKLKKEQGGICMYTGKTISMARLFDDNSFDIEHTIPLSMSFDNSDRNRTVCDAYYNRNIKGNLLPTACPNYDHDCVINGKKYTAIKPRLSMWEDKVERLEKIVNYWLRKTKEARDKDRKDSCIRQRLVWQMELDYWKEKLRHFQITEVTDGFRNSQLVDTGIITRYAVIYLKTVFQNVDVQKGEVTSVFRKILGIQPSSEAKDRSLHSHHAVDATMLTVMPVAAKRDRMLQFFYEKEEKEKMLNHTKSEELRNSIGQEIDGLKRKLDMEKKGCGIGKAPAEIVDFINKNILVTHHSNDKALLQGRRKERVRGKIQKDAEGNIKLVSSDSIRGPLHDRTYLGAITQWEKDDNNNYIKGEDGHNIINPTPLYVVRMPLRFKANALDKGFTDWKDLENKIVDKALYKILRQQYSEDAPFREAAEKGFFMLDKKGNKVYANQIRHIRCFSSAQKPEPIKQQAYLSKKEYKQHIYAPMGSGTKYALCEYTNGMERVMKAYGLFDLSKFKRYYQEGIPPFIEGKKGILQLSKTLRKGDMVLIYKDSPTELYDLDMQELSKKLYVIKSIENDGRLTMWNHLLASMKKDDDESGKKNKKSEKGSSIKDFNNLPPIIRQGLGKMRILKKGTDFSISLSEHGNRIVFIR